MHFDIDYDEHGKPCYVRTDNGFISTGGRYEESEHGWMLTQINPPEPRTPRELVNAYDDAIAEVNRLRYELWNTKQLLSKFTQR